MKTLIHIALMVSALSLSNSLSAEDLNGYIFEPGHSSLQKWLLPKVAPSPENNPQSQEKIQLGKMLFFDPRLSGDGSMSCASCHNPMLGWSDAQPVARGHKSQLLQRATPTITNAGFNHIQMWDGRAKTLEEQAIGPMEAVMEMNSNFEQLLSLLKNTQGYVDAFEVVFPTEGINKETVVKAIASFERTVVSNNSPFDAWVRGDRLAMTILQIQGFKLFIDPGKGNCAVCHSAPNFTDDGFHNIGLVSFGVEEPDLGRYRERPLNLMKGAFKTPTLRDISLSAPYFHDGSAETLEDVLAFYNLGGEVKTNLSPNLKTQSLTQDEMAAIIAFLQGLSSAPKSITLPLLPQ
ncbi:cytochrome-c peroxidase [Shewanella psychrophila]|uniref:cytochrome-c peroxidase n=1 Tax=Shewanella psychrophila TaxID=225848 RepID=UPI001F019A1A|nr:cytochrome c peroxidase [Shewanella psychrophila]